MSRPACSRRMDTISTTNSSATCSPHISAASDSGSSAMRGAATSSKQRVPSCTPYVAPTCERSATSSRGRRSPAVLPRHWEHSFETSTTSLLRTAVETSALSDVPRLAEERLPHQVSLPQSPLASRARRGGWLAAPYSTPAVSKSAVHENRILLCRLTDKV